MPSRPHVLLIVPFTWHDHPPGLAALRDALYHRFGATFASQWATSDLPLPVLELTGAWPVNIHAQLGPLITRAYDPPEELVGT